MPWLDYCSMGGSEASRRSSAIRDDASPDTHCIDLLRAVSVEGQSSMFPTYSPPPVEARHPPNHKSQYSPVDWQRSKKMKTFVRFTWPVRALLIGLMMAAILHQSNAASASERLSGPTKPAPWIEVMSEDFESSFPSGLWSRYDDNGGDEHLWGKDSSWSHSGASSAWAARDGAQGIYPTLGYYPAWVASRMVYGPFDLSDASEAILQFFYSHISPEDHDWFCWQASVDGTAFHGPCVSGDHNNWNYQEFDLTNVPTLGNITGQNSVWIQFRFNSDGVDNSYQGPWLDDIKLYMYPSEALAINEIDPGGENRVEIFNPASQSVDMGGMSMAFYDGYGLTATYTLPSVSVPAEGYMTVHGGAGTDTSTDLYIGNTIDWSYKEGGAVELEAFGGGAIDFVRWGDSSVSPPAGTYWSGDNPSVIPHTRALGRDPNGADSDDGSDWCIQDPTIGSANGGCAYKGDVVINEIDVGGEFLNTQAAVELRNKAGQPVSLGGWQLAFIEEGSVDVLYTIPSFTLGPDSYVVIHEGTGSDSSTDLYIDYASNWDIYSNGAAGLTDGLDGIDFVRWGSSTTPPPAGTGWSGINPAIPSLGVDLGRDSASSDSDTGDDWCPQPPSLGDSNLICAGTDDSVGTFNPLVARFFLRDDHSNGAPDYVIRYGKANSNWVPLTGDWDGDGADSVGIYNPDVSRFMLRDANSSGPPDYGYRYGPAGQGWLPIVGDWDGDGTDTVGVFDPTRSLFLLANSHSPSSFDIRMFFGPPDQGWVVVSGDWDGDGDDTLGVYNPASGEFRLRNSNTTGGYDLSFFFGPGGEGWIPITGDWDADGLDTVGIYNPTTAQFRLRNRLSFGPPDVAFRFGAASAGWIPVAGDWDGE
jgi:hypothetical protein